MRKLTLILALVCVTFLKAQFTNSLHFGVGVGTLNFKQFNTYVANFNKLNKGLLSKEMKFNPYTVGAEFGGLFYTSNIVLGISGYMGKTIASTNASFSDATLKRKFAIADFMQYFGYNVLRKKGKKSGFIYIGMSAQNLRIKSSLAFNNTNYEQYRGAYTSSDLRGIVGFLFLKGKFYLNANYTLGKSNLGLNSGKTFQDQSIGDGDFPLNPALNSLDDPGLFPSQKPFRITVGRVFNF